MHPMAIRVVSLDLEGTLVDESFSEFVWNEGIPRLYAEKHGLGFDESKAKILAEYDKVGDSRIEWYDIRYWFTRFNLEYHEQFLKRYVDRVKYYPEVFKVLEELERKYTLILLTNSSREFINILAAEVAHYFKEIFSTTSDFRALKRKRETYVRVCEHLNLNPRNVVHIGDRLEDDFSSPRRIGMHAFLLNRSEKTSEEYVVNNLRDFSDRLKSLIE